MTTQTAIFSQKRRSKSSMGMSQLYSQPRLGQGGKSPNELFMRQRDDILAA